MKHLQIIISTVLLFLFLYVAILFTLDKSYTLQSIAELHSDPVFILYDVVLLVSSLFLQYLLNYNLYSVIISLKKELARILELTKENVDFTESLIDDKLESDKSAADDDLGKMLLQLKNKLVNNKKDEEQRKLEDFQRNWATEGQAKFAELLRNVSNKSLDDLSYVVVSNLVSYLSANQGGVFLLQDSGSEKYFELSACYAYERRRLEEKRVNWQEGLVGRCGIEMLPIYMTDVPQRYTQITSGLGEETPTSLFLCPVVANEELLGVIELASFKEMQEYEHAFIEKIAEIFGATISGVKINMQTETLLKESQEQGRRMTEQEQEMRQNMEEMKVLQYEAAEQSKEFISFSNTVNHTMIRADYDVNGTLLYANTNFLKKLGYTGNAEVEGKNISMFINEKDADWFKSLWSKLSEGGSHYEGFMKHITKDRKDLWTLSTYTCVRDTAGRVKKIMFLAIDITEKKLESLNLEAVNKALNQSNYYAEFDFDGLFLTCNTNLSAALNYRLDEIQKIKLFSICTCDDEMISNWEGAQKGITFEKDLKFLSKDNSEKWIHGTFTAVKDMYGDIVKIIFIGSDITQQKIAEFRAEQQHKTLQEQEKALQEAQIHLEMQLEATRKEMKEQFRKTEIIKELNEKTLEGALDAIITFDELGNIIFFNKAAEELLGYHKKDVMNAKVDMLFSEDTKHTNAFVKKLVDVSASNIVGERVEIPMMTKSMVNVNVLVLLSEAKIEDNHTYTAFIQNIEIELF